GSEKLYPHTGVIVAIGQSAESTLVTTTEGIDTTNTGLLTVDSEGKTTRAGVFAGGDAVNGARTVVEAVATAKKVAVAMDEYLKSLPPKNEEDPYKDIPVYDEPILDAFSEQFLGSTGDRTE
ncbi:MAG: FAD-dependent oxidoreductase, partial [Bullifex sp.]